MLEKLLAGAGGNALSYSDITVVTSGTIIGNASITFSPALQQNDVVFLIIGDNDVDYTIPSGYIEITGEVITTIYRFSCYYKVMGSNPDNGINLNDGNDTSGGTYYVLRNVQTQSPVIEVNYTVGSSSSTNLTPPALSAPAKSVFLVAGFTANGASATLTAAPSGYTGFLTRDVSGNSDTFVGSAYKVITTTGTETPGAFTLSSTAAAYGAVSIVVRPYSNMFTDIAPVLVATTAVQNSSSGSTLVMDKPLGTADGDLMIALLTAGGGTVSGWTGPAGWNEVADSTTGRPVNAAYWKTASSEGTSYTFTAGTSRTLAGAILTYRYAAYDAISAFSTQVASPTIPSALAATQQSNLLSIVGYDLASSGTTIIGMTSRIVNNDAIAPSYRISSSPLAKGPSGTRNTTTGGANSNGIQLVIKPTGAPKAIIELLSYGSSLINAAHGGASIVTPISVLAGDVLVWTNFGVGAEDSAIPSGFTLLEETSLSDGPGPTIKRTLTAYKIATGAEGGTTLTGMSVASANNSAAFLLVFRGKNAFSSVSTGTWNGEVTNATPAQQTVSPPSVGIVLVLAVAAARSTSADISFSTQSPSFANTLSIRDATNLQAMTVGCTAYAASATTQTIAIGDNGNSNTLQSGYLLLV